MPRLTSSFPTRSIDFRLLASLAAVSGALLAGAAQAHDAPSGWTYPYSCCSGIDCRQISTAAVSARPEGYRINTTGEVVSYRDARVRYSPDGQYHWCSVAGADDGRTICLFVPQPLF